MTVRFLSRTTLMFLCTGFLAQAPLRSAEDGLIDSIMYSLPNLAENQSVFEYRNAKELWLKALARPEVEMKCRAAETIAAAHMKGVKGLESTVPALLAALNESTAHPAVRLAAAKALVNLDAKVAAPAFFTAMQGPILDLREIVEPALAKWGHEPARAVWRTRLTEGGSNPRERILAVRGLSALGDQESISLFRTLASASRESIPLRLAAARAVGILSPRGAEEIARPLLEQAGRSGLSSRLVALELLRHHQSEMATQLQVKAISDPDPAVALLAAESLRDRDPGLLTPLLDRLQKHPDAGLRRITAEVIQARPTEADLPRLMQLLSDDHSGVRLTSRQALAQLARDPSRSEVIRVGMMRILATDEWKSLEQATILLCQLDHKPAASLLVRLLDHPRPETYLAAGWGLRKLNVPETLPQSLKYAIKRVGTQQKADYSEDVWYNHQLSHLNQFFGLQKYLPADAYLRGVVDLPTGKLLESRCAGIWALGMIHQGKAIPELGKRFEAAIRGYKAPIPSEDSNAARMAALSLGRMKSQDHLGILQECYSGQITFDPLNNASGWAIEQITGKKVPAPGTSIVPRGDWFLVPLTDPSEKK